MSALPSLPVDLQAIGVARRRLERALELVTTIETAGQDLAELVGDDQDDGATARALDPPPFREDLDDVRDRQEDELEPAPTPSPPRPDSAADAPPAPAAEPPASAPAPQTSPPADENLPGPGRERQAPTGATLANAVRGARTRKCILEHLACLPPGTWVAARDLKAAMAGLDISGGSVTTALRNLLANNELEHNGALRNGARYRLPTVDAEPEQGGTTRPAAAGTAQPAPPAPASPTERNQGGSPAPAPQPTAMSPRVRRELERDARDRAAASHAADPRAGTLEGRITEALTAGPAGIRGLALRLRFAHPTEELIETLAIMVRHGDVRRFDNPRRAQIGEENPLFEVIY